MSDSSANLLAHAEELRRRLAREGVLVIEVKAVHRARSAEVSDVMADGVLKVKVQVAPEKGRANEEILTVLAAFLGLPKRNLELLAGQTVTQKRIKISAA